MPTKCNAPCIINTAIGFQLVLCEAEHDHGGNRHFATLVGDKKTVVSWAYLGQPCDGGTSVTLPLHQRCDSSTQVAQPPQLAPGILEPMYRMSLMTITEAPAATTGFCCEKAPGHRGHHMRSGMFDPLGMRWVIQW